MTVILLERYLKANMSNQHVPAEKKRYGEEGCYQVESLTMEVAGSVQGLSQKALQELRACW